MKSQLAAAPQLGVVVAAGIPALQKGRWEGREFKGSLDPVGHPKRACAKGDLFQTQQNEAECGGS